MKKEEKKGEKRGRMGVEKAEEGRESGTGERMGAKGNWEVSFFATFRFCKGGNAFLLRGFLASSLEKRE